MGKVMSNSTINNSSILDLNAKKPALQLNSASLGADLTNVKATNSDFKREYQQAVSKTREKAAHEKPDRQSQSRAERNDRGREATRTEANQQGANSSRSETQRSESKRQQKQDSQESQASSGDGEGAVNNKEQWTGSHSSALGDPVLMGASELDELGGVYRDETEEEVVIDQTSGEVLNALQGVETESVESTRLTNEVQQNLIGRSSEQLNDEGGKGAGKDKEAQQLLGKKSLMQANNSQMQLNLSQQESQIKQSDAHLQKESEVDTKNFQTVMDGERLHMGKPESTSESTRPVLQSTRINTPFSKPDWSQAVNQRIVWLANREISAARIIMDPPELGPIEVQLKMKNESTQVFFYTHSSAVKEVLEESLPRLKELFESNGLELADAGVQDQSAQNGEEGEDENSGGTGASHGLLTEEERQGAEGQEVVEEIGVSETLVDYYI